MLASAIPTRFQIAWAKNAGGSFIRTVPVASQIGINAGAASYNDGFVPDNFTQIAAGGVPPFGQDMNGVLNETTVWDQWYQAGGAITFDPTFAGAIGGYPEGAILDSAVVLGKKWLSLVDNNTTNPDAGGANWVQTGGLLTGLPIPSLSSSPLPQCVLANSLTVGNASSNATSRANADTVFIFNFCWALPASSCPIFTSTGASATRGANPAADFAANMQIATPNMKGLSVIGADTMGGSASTFLTGVPVTIGNATIPGSIVGENLHQLVTGELPTVTPAGTIANGAITINNQGNVLTAGSAFSSGSVVGLANVGSALTASQAASLFTGTPFGSNTPHNNVERSTVVYWNLPL